MTGDAWDRMREVADRYPDVEADLVSGPEVDGAPQGVTVVVRRRPSLLDLAREAWPRIERMGVDAIAQAHAAGVPAWVSEDGTLWRLDPDGTRHVETRSADEVTAARDA